MALWRLYYHLVWATRQREPFITTRVEPYLQGYILGKSDELDCLLHAIGGIEDHLHLIVSVPPKLALADFVKRIKGRYLRGKSELALAEFNWQGGYGAFSLDSKQLEPAVTYVRGQKEHHRQGTTISVLEQEADLDNAPNIWQQGAGIAGVKAIRSDVLDS